MGLSGGGVTNGGFRSPLWIVGYNAEGGVVTTPSAPGAGIAIGEEMFF
jgi:hypothetical protein